jgi:hypothetical protein
MTARPADWAGHTPSLTDALCRQRATDARNYRDGIANAIADIVAQGMTPAQGTIERYRAAALASQLASQESRAALRAALEVAS